MYRTNPQNVMYSLVVPEAGITIREYLKLLLTTLWTEGERFSGKRPLGNSGWQYDVYHQLVKNNFVTGTFNEDDMLEEVDTKEANKLILELIANL